MGAGRPLVTFDPECRRSGSHRALARGVMKAEQKYRSSGHSRDENQLEAPGRDDMTFQDGAAE